MNDVLDYITTRLKPFAFSYAKNIQDTEDLIQDTILQCLRMGDRYDHLTIEQRRQVAATTMKNIFMDKKRKNKLKMSQVDSYEGLDTPTQFFESFDYKILQGVIDNGSIYVKAFFLYFCGYSGKEISAHFNISPKAGGNYVSIGRKILRKELHKLHAFKKLKQEKKFVKFKKYPQNIEQLSKILNEYYRFYQAA